MSRVLPMDLRVFRRIGAVAVKLRVVFPTTSSPRPFSLGCCDAYGTRFRRCPLTRIRLSTVGSFANPMARDPVEEHAILDYPNRGTSRVARRGTIGCCTCSYVIAWSARGGSQRRDSSRDRSFAYIYFRNKERTIFAIFLTSRWLLV